MSDWVPPGYISVNRRLEQIRRSLGNEAPIESALADLRDRLASGAETAFVYHADGTVSPVAAQFWWGRDAPKVLQCSHMILDIAYAVAARGTLPHRVILRMVSPQPAALTGTATPQEPQMSPSEQLATIAPAKTEAEPAASTGAAKKARGPEAVVRKRIVAKMLSDLRARVYTAETLRREKQVALVARYVANRETVTKARKIALSEFELPTNSDK